jgi:hypothetical protein
LIKKSTRSFFSNKLIEFHKFYADILRLKENSFYQLLRPESNRVQIVGLVECMITIPIFTKQYGVLISTRREMIHYLEEENNLLYKALDLEISHFHSHYKQLINQMQQRRVLEYNF